MVEKEHEKSSLGAKPKQLSVFSAYNSISKERKNANKALLVIQKFTKDIKMDNLIDTNDRQQVLNQITEEASTPIEGDTDDHRFDFLS